MNWQASRLPEFRIPAGTPGRRNDSYSANLPPAISAVEMKPEDQSTGTGCTISALIADEDGVQQANLVYSLVSAAKVSQETSLEMKRVSGEAKDGRYKVTVPFAGPELLTRYRIEARDERGARRTAADRRHFGRTSSRAADELRRFTRTHTHNNGDRK